MRKLEALLERTSFEGGVDYAWLSAGATVRARIELSRASALVLDTLAVDDTAREGIERELLRIASYLAELQEAPSQDYVIALHHDDPTVTDTQRSRCTRFSQLLQKLFEAKLLTRTRLREITVAHPQLAPTVRSFGKTWFTRPGEYL